MKAPDGWVEHCQIYSTEFSERLGYEEVKEMNRYLGEQLMEELDEFAPGTELMVAVKVGKTRTGFMRKMGDYLGPASRKVVTVYVRREEA